MQNSKMQDYGLTPLSYTESLNTDGGVNWCPCGPCQVVHGVWDVFRGIYDGIAS
jgi:hypothetical protein